MRPPPRANSWLLLRSGAGDCAFNMAMDEVLLLRAGSLGSPVLRLYSWTERPASFGYFQKFAEMEGLTGLRPLVRRPTGGGLVPHGSDWTYSVAVPPSSEWYALRALETYLRVHEWVRRALLEMDVETSLADRCRKASPGQCFEGYEQLDVLWHGRKVAGAAQRRTRAGLLIQGSVQPPHSGLAPADWEKAMCVSAEKNEAVQWGEMMPDAELIQRGLDLAEKKYSNPEYTRQR